MDLLATCGEVGYMYCKFGNFRDNFIFANSVKGHICDVKNRKQGMIYISVNDIVISPIHEFLIFTKVRICEISQKINSRGYF